ncbi:FAD-binding protein [Bifidobacterium commune]|nr:FAD-binding protein [Bifidobacterium commune]
MLADLTTIAVGGPVDRFIEPETEEAFVSAVRDADAAKLPLLTIGGGSNLLAGDEPFHGVVIRDGRRSIVVCGAKSSKFGENGDVEIVAEAGVNWDDFVVFCVESGFSGVEGLSGVPGTVGASVVQNIGAYGQEVASTVVSVCAFDREAGVICELSRDDMRFGYRNSALKSTMYKDPAMPADHYFPTPRYVVLSVTFRLHRSDCGEVAFGQLAKAFGVDVGATMPIAEIRRAVLQVRAAKGMLEDARRYASPWMLGCKDDRNVAQAIDADMTADADYDRHSCGSFFMNPILDEHQAAKLPADAPQFDAVRSDGSRGIKTSAAWLIDHAGFAKGYKIRENAHAGLSSLHTLALTNRGGATADDIVQLAQVIQEGVEATFGVRLVPEPVVVGMTLQ